MLEFPICARWVLCSIRPDDLLIHFQEYPIQLVLFYQLFSLADLTVLTIPLSIIFLIMKGLNNSAAIPLGSPHSCNFNVGPTTITDLAE